MEELYRLKACRKCGGDLAFDEGDWICLQCGVYYYVGLYRRMHPRRPAHPDEGPAKEVGLAAYRAIVVGAYAPLPPPAARSAGIAGVSIR